jgi:hypothetical protein
LTHSGFQPNERTAKTEVPDIIIYFEDLPAMRAIRSSPSSGLQVHIYRQLLEFCWLKNTSRSLPKLDVADQDVLIAQ